MLTLYTMILLPTEDRLGMVWDGVTLSVPVKYRGLVGAYAEFRDSEWHVPHTDLTLWLQLPGVRLA